MEPLLQRGSFAYEAEMVLTEPYLDNLVDTQYLGSTLNLKVLNVIWWLNKLLYEIRHTTISIVPEYDTNSGWIYIYWNGSILSSLVCLSLVALLVLLGVSCHSYSVHSPLYCQLDTNELSLGLWQGIYFCWNMTVFTWRRTHSIFYSIWFDFTMTYNIIQGN